MKEQLYALTARLEKSLAAGETLLCNLSAGTDWPDWCLTPIST
jgi:hypothetical protein